MKTMQEVQALIRNLREIYTDVRLLDEAMVERIQEGKRTDPCGEDLCYACRHKEHISRHCAAKQALRTRTEQCRLEFFDPDIAQVIARYYEVDGKPYVLEMIKRTHGTSVLDMEDSEHFISSIPGYATKLYRDALTGVYNRRYYEETVSSLIGPAGVAVMDLDDFKIYNDTYGHHAGDLVLETVARVIRNCIRQTDTLIRFGGDEFLLLFYGYPGREQLREKLEALTRAMQQAVVVLPSGSDLHISISGGVAWYPEDGRDIETLKKYADFAMYQVKHSTKGQMKDFDIGVYNQEAYIARTRREFHQLISEERMYYYFQPIFSAQTGRVHAYEALMRSDLPTLRSPATIMKLAREQGALYEIERLTFRKALEGFDKLRSKNLVDRQALIFINSIASVCLRREDSEYMDQRWHELRRQMVIEITEEEEMNREALEIKRHAPGFSGMFALDDYGSGYSNEGSLLELAPRFIKVDISIIRGIDSDPDKQQILRNVVRYAQPRNMQIIAEGVETAAEMRTVIDLGADLLQGYFLARPAAVPDPIAPEAAEIIRAIQDSNRRKRF